MCAAAVPLPEKVAVGSLVYCPECDAELEVLNLNPVELDWPLEDFEDEQFDFDDEPEEYEEYDY